MQPYRWFVHGGILFLYLLLFGGTGGLPALRRFPAAVVITSTPQPDGSLIHVVRPGESLWTIAVAYGVYIQDIQRMNDMSFDQEKIISGEKLRIPTRQPTFLTPKAAPTATPVPIVNQVVATAASYAATETAVAGASQLLKPTPTASPVLSTAMPIPDTGHDFSHVIQTILIIFGVLGLALVVFGLAVQR